ncbi:hypothetical protein DWY01_09100 [Eubacterium sp. AF22-8LB]|uniref:SpaA isopeptide-forming pilin-related protein n=1 Tax=Eubacterium sp. AF22-8LB TaxID=2292232 RepID=UPI000E4F78E6|nr:SpaA isopeptide-forming pilin-related protein [Eubacterium sp. AF22-8LB]RGS29538.1 hypothetical protein DWY01_09100 [Eubacterium sp. AF22-8LB]
MTNPEEEQDTTEGEETTTQTDYELTNNDITSIEVDYKDANGHWQKVDINNGEVNPGDTEIYLKVNFEKIKIEDLLNQHNCTLTYQIPDFLRDAQGAGKLYEGTEIIGTITVVNNQAKVTLDKAYLQKLIETGKTHLKGYFWVQGQINLATIVNKGDKAVLTLGDKTVTLNYGPDCIEKFGGVTIKKEFKEVDKINNYVAYKITVEAGKDGCKNLYVIDQFTSNGNLVNYEGITPTETELKDSSDNHEPCEIVKGSINHGKIYLADSADSTTKIPDSGETNITKPCIVWNIQNMGANESRELTYYVKLKDDVYLRNQQITNTATLYSNGSQGVYDRGSGGEAKFTPTIDYTGKFTKSVNGNIKRNNDGSYTIPFKLAVATDKDKSNYTIKNLQFRDYLRNIDSDLLQYVTFDNNSFELYKNDQPIDATKYNVKWSTETNNTNFKEWNEVENPKSFKLSGNEGSPIDLSPGESCYVTYNVIVKPEAFAKMHSDSITVDNRFVAHADNVDQRLEGGFDAWFSKPIIKTYEWNGKQVNQNATTKDLSETINGDKYTYNGDKVEKDSDSENSFTVPKGSYKYTVETNKTLNDFDVTDVTMTDTLTSKYMKYVGYVKVEALQANTISSDLNKESSDTYTLQPTYETVGTKWVKIDGRKSFSLKPFDLGWTDTDKKYAYRFTYYAKPDNLGAFTETTVKNKFTLKGIVKKGKGEFNFTENDVSKETTLTIKGSLNMTVKKVSWYYNEPTKDSGAWSKGELYWVVDVGGTQIAQGTTFRDLIKTDDKTTESYLHDDSLVGIYKGTLPNGKSISDYKDLNDLTSNVGLTPIKDEFKTDFNGTAPNYNELFFTANDDIKLENGEKVYMIIKSEPAELPSPTNNRDTKTFKNSISIENDNNYVSEQTAEKTLYTAPNILKELGQVFKYDGKTVTNLQIGADKTDSGTADTSKICTDLLKDSHGVFVSWAFKVNYDGKLNGEYNVLEDIPEGMELSYIRLKWHGADASSVRSKEISGIDSTVWEEVNNTSTNDNKESEDTIYYVNKNNKQAMIQLGDFVAKEERDNNSVDVQVVCRVTDSKVLLGAESQTFTNKVTLKKDDKIIDTAKSAETIQLTEENKNIDKKQGQSNGQKIDFEINANQLGQTLPTNDGDKLKLVDELGENLQLDTTSIKVFKNDTVQLTDCDTSYTNNTLEITVPNNVPIKITYTVTVNAKPGDSVKVSNTAYWKGYSKDSGKTVGYDYSYTVGGGIEAFSKVNFKLTKQDEYNLNKVLQGAEFNIEKCELNENGITTSKIVSVTTGVDGTIAQDLDFDTLYKITETKAPDGYVLNSKPIYILDVKDKDKSYVTNIENIIKDGKLFVRYKQQNFDIQVQNRKGEITVVKKFINDAAGKSTNPVSGTYSFGLYDNAQGNGDRIQTQTITYNAGKTQEQSVKFINLELGKTYYVFELDDKGNPIVNSSQEVTINKLQYRVEYKNEKGESPNAATNGQTVTVTNRSRTKILPSTGGYGSLLYRISGAMLALASLIYLTNIYKKNHLDDTSKKRRKK